MDSNRLNTADTRRNRHQLLKGKQLYSALYGVYTEVLHGLTAVLKESVTKGEKAKTTITSLPSLEEFREQSKRKWKLTDDVDKTSKKPTASTIEVNDPQLRSKPKVPIRNFFSVLRSIEMEADNGHDADDATEHPQHQAPFSQEGRPSPIVVTSQVNLI
jgi:hypothetical protein